jgi:uncharacterized secreted protein with C-terminal beta-propeller domain
MFCKKLLVGGVIFTLSACGGSSSDPVNIIEPVASMPNLNEMSVPLGSLAQQNGIEFERHLKNGVYLRNQNSFKINFSDSPESSSTNVGANFSTTINQEQGVDEGDRIKYDGEYLFIASQEPYVGLLEGDVSENNEHTVVRILRRTHDGAISEVNKLVVNEEATHINSLYLNNDVLAVLSDIYQYNIAASSFLGGFFPQEQNFNLTLMSVINPQVPNETASFTIDGSIIDSRRVGDVLYVVSSFSAKIGDLVYGDTDEEQLDNYNSILETDINDLLPRYTDGDGVEHNLVNAESCYIPEQATEFDGFDGIVTLTAIDLKSPGKLQSVCVNAQVQGLYASPSSVYLYGTEFQYQDNTTVETSVIHKFSFQGQSINYQASGNLDGRFNWGLSNLRFSEQGEYLRVVTTTGDRISGYQHRLNVLTQEANTLSVISQLPNDINPKLIGKQSDDGNVYEDIKSVRFYLDQAYVVTFLNTDPLYVIDLKDNLHPKISGELEIPGYSAYLHPISDDLLLGIGQSVDPTRIPNNISEDGTSTGVDEDDSPVIEGAKVSLFDISDKSNPKEIHSIIYGQSYTPVEYDYHALTALTMNNGNMRFSIPIERWLTETVVDENQQKYDVWRAENNLALFEVTGTTKEASLIDKGSITAEFPDDTQSNFISGWDDRAIFHDDDVYYIHGSNVWQSSWNLLDVVTGPL